jgi:hypothetical protein
LATEKRHGVAVWLCLAAAFYASSAGAQNESAEDKASARVLGTEGIKLAESGDCASAIPKLEAAEKLYHAPTTLERLGECQVSQGRLVAGTESLNRVVREPLPANPPAAFVSARQRAQQVLTTAMPRIGKLRIHVDGATPEQVSVTVDGASVPSALFDADRPTDPGNHLVKAVAPGFRDATAQVRLADGEGRAVSLTLEADPNAVVAVIPPPQPGMPPPTTGTVTTTTTTAETTTSSGGGNRGLALGVLGLGAAGLVVGTVFGVLALSEKSTLDGECVQKSCPGASQSDINALGTRATVSTVGFGVGIAGVAVGTVLLLTSRRAESRPPAAALRVTPWVGLGTAGLGGTFE